MKFTKNIGMLLLAIYLIAHAVVAIFSISVPAMVLPILAGVAGVFILMGR